MKIMNLIDDWQRVLSRSISLWFGIVGLILLPVPDILFVYFNLDLDPKFVFWVLYGLVSVGVVGRLFKQNQNLIIEWFRMISILIMIFIVAYFSSSYSYSSTQFEYSKQGKALDVAVPLIAKWEGLRTKAYLDIIGVPTICYGSTRGVKLGMTKTKKECDDLLRDEVEEYRSGWLSYVSEKAYINWLPPTRDAAYTSLAYNVGISAAGNSTATKRLNKKKIKGGCIAIGWWNRAGGRVVMGLVNRRSDEVKLCLKS